MSLRSELMQKLPDVLPKDPKDALFGTELLKLMRPHLSGGYADNSIRQHFSVMSTEPNSPIAKVSQGHGYYLRPPVVAIVEEVLPKDGPLPSAGSPTGVRNEQSEEKFRALFIRYASLNNRFPVLIEHTKALRQQSGINKWKFPDVVVLDWDVGRISDAGYRIDKELLEVKKSLGDQPFRLTSVELKASLSLSSLRENFFQCVSNSKWAHNAYLVVATSVQDESLVRELRRLGTSFDVSVISYGLTSEKLASLPNAAQIMEFSDEEIETLTADVVVTTISSGRAREAVDWEHIEDMRAQSSEFNQVFVWIARCLSDANPYAFMDFVKIAKVEKRYR